MQKKLTSNWMGHKDSAPVIFRAASRGKVFTRTEKLRQIFDARKVKEAKAARVEMILKARNEAKAEAESRQAGYRGINLLAENPSAKVRRGKDGQRFIQPRVNGSFGPKITL